MNRWFASVLLLVALVMGSDAAMTEQLKVGENLRREQVLLPPSMPDRNRMVLRDTLLFLESGGASEIFIYYDDARTKQDIDYIEFYDLEGDLLVVSWIDRRGVCQVAMDRGLLEAENPAVTRKLVVVGVGTEL
jgi:hypothetical protein